MEAKLAIKANDITMDFIDGIMKVFSKDALLDITVNYDPELSAASGKQGSQDGAPKGAKRGPKPKQKQVENPAQAPKKRGRKPKVAAEPAES
jgi:hypothetical protein